MYPLSLSHNIEQTVKSEFSYVLEYNQDKYVSEAKKNTLFLSNKLLTESVFDKIIKHLDNLYNCNIDGNKIGKEVYSNTYRIIENLTPTILNKTNVGLIYVSDYRTLIIEWEREDDIFTLDIGKNSIEYFSEINGNYSIEENVSFNVSSYKNSLINLLNKLVSFIS